MIHSKETGQTVYDADGVKGVKLYESAGNEYVHLTIQPNSGIPEHRRPITVSFCVLEGRGICNVAEASHDMLKGQMLECPLNAPRNWFNPTDAVLEVLDIKRVAP